MAALTRGPYPPPARAQLAGVRCGQQLEGPNRKGGCVLILPLISSVCPEAEWRQQAVSLSLGAPEVMMSECVGK